MAEYLPSRVAAREIFCRCTRLGKYLPLFTEIEKNNCFSIYTRSDLKTDNLDIFKRKPMKGNFIDV